MKFKDKRILVIGAGESGRSCAAFLESEKAIVTVYDDSFENQTTEDDYDFVVLSPGVSINHPVAQRFAEKLTSEMAVGFTKRHKPIVAVTGTNGKTTVTNMIAGALGRRGVLCGNSGIPVTSLIRDIRKKTPVTEVSSFMLETVVAQVLKRPKFRPKIAVILNITQDHLERHGTMENYTDHKAAIFKNQHRRDITLLNYDDEIVRDLAYRTKARVLYFSQQARVRGIYTDGGFVWLNIGRRAKKLFSLHELRLNGTHEVANFLATALVVALVGGKATKLREVRGSLDHRIQYVATHDNVSFYNDSKATNIAATLAACSSFEVPVNLLVGGVAKGQDFAKLFEGLPKNVAAVFAFGEAQSAIADAAKAMGFSPAFVFETMQEATNAAKEHGVGGRVVLLSPACASFDQFKNYADRGEQFMEVVRAYLQ